MELPDRDGSVYPRPERLGSLRQRVCIFIHGLVERVELNGLGHTGLLNPPRVCALIRAWLAAPAG
jgi:hypothetical protein